MDAGKTVRGYSSTQVALHWIVVALVAFQFLAHQGIEDSWRGYLRNDMVSARTVALTYLHITAGTLVLFLALARLYLRFSRGVPPPPADEPRVLQLVADIVHWSIYAFLLLLPITGATAWFFGVEAAAIMHELLKNLLLGAITLHITGALFQHLILRSPVLMRMFHPERS